MINRRTKILATLGPSTDNPEVLKGILDAGVNVVRINFSHNNEKEHLERIAQIRKYEKENDSFIGILMDLQGPKIRISGFKDGSIELKKGDHFALDAELDESEGSQDSVGIAYKELPNDLNVGNTLLLDDGKIILEVQQIKGQKILTKVSQGGILSNNKGINLRGGGLSASALTEKDKQDIITAAKADADYVAISFPINADKVSNKLILLYAMSVNCCFIFINSASRTLSEAGRIVPYSIPDFTSLILDSNCSFFAFNKAFFSCSNKIEKYNWLTCFLSW